MNTALLRIVVSLYALVIAIVGVLVWMTVRDGSDFVNGLVTYDTKSIYTETVSNDIVKLQKQWQRVAYEQRLEASMQRRWIMTFGAVIAICNFVNLVWTFVENGRQATLYSDNSGAKYSTQCV